METGVRPSLMNLAASLAAYGFRPFMNFFWKEFINGLNPYAAKDAARFIKEGLTPVSISVTTLAGFADYLTEFPSDISLPKVAVDTDKVWLLILHEKGHAWLPLSAADSPRLTS